MIYFGAIWAALMRHYTKCPDCGKVQHFNEKKSGDVVTCQRCGHRFVLKEKQ